jgi:hypothetical protein
VSYLFRGIAIHIRFRWRGGWGFGERGRQGLLIEGKSSELLGNTVS